MKTVVYLLNPTSNHNIKTESIVRVEVVYLLNPTSNHNPFVLLISTILLYIFWILHQTTTLLREASCELGLYIFWILHQTTTYHRRVLHRSALYIFWILHQTTTDNGINLALPSCISFESYIKPQLHYHYSGGWWVVYLLNPTSNHNGVPVRLITLLLYIFWILHQTTTLARSGALPFGCISFESYIKPQLASFCSRKALCCISFESYIKPQLSEIM